MTTPAIAALEPRKAEAGRGWDWFVEAVGLFRQSPGIWIGICLVYVVIIIAASAVPGASLLTTLFGPVFSGGLILACASQDAGTGVRIEHLFAGFRGSHFGQLVLLAVLYLGAILALVIVGAILAIAVLGLSPSHLDVMRSDPTQYFLPMLLLITVLFGLFIPVMMGMWLAPALIALRNIGPVDAFKLSFKACMVNWAPLLIYGLVVLLVPFVIAIPVGIIWAASSSAGLTAIVGFILLVLFMVFAMPVAFISIYTAYRDMFPMPPPPPPVDFNATQPLPVPPPL